MLLLDISLVCCLFNFMYNLSLTWNSHSFQDSLTLALRFAAYTLLLIMCLSPGIPIDSHLNYLNSHETESQGKCYKFATTKHCPDSTFAVSKGRYKWKQELVLNCGPFFKF